MPVVDNVRYAGNCAVGVIDNGLDKYELMKDTRLIASRCFMGCEKMKTFSFPVSITSIGDFAFYGCTSLSFVEIGDYINTIGESAFYGCTSLSSVEMGDSVSFIGNSAFAWCTNLSSVQIGSSLTKIADALFNGCAELKSVLVPNSVRSIGKSAFSGCTKLTSINLPNSVTEINEYAFANCDALTNVTLPSSIKSIANYIFNGCKGLEYVICCATKVPYARSHAFDSYVQTYAILVVPEIALNAYKYESPWNGFCNFMTLEEFNATNINNIQENEKELCIYQNSCVLSIIGLHDVESITAYSIGGDKVATARAVGDVATLDLTAYKGKVVILKIGEKSIKILVK